MITEEFRDKFCALRKYRQGCKDDCWDCTFKLVDQDTEPITGAFTGIYEEALNQLRKHEEEWKRDHPFEKLEVVYSEPVIDGHNVSVKVFYTAVPDTDKMHFAPEKAKTVEFRKWNGSDET